jgi:hypothetical protein
LSQGGARLCAGHDLLGRPSAAIAVAGIDVEPSESRATSG